MRLLKRRVIGTGAHHGGWPRAMRSLSEVATGTGPLLDDFVDASFGYLTIKEPRFRPWVGIFHHSVNIAGPLPGDRKQELRWIETHRHWKKSKSTLLGAIALCEEVAEDLRNWLEIPTIVLRHPTILDVPRWNYDSCCSNRSLLQAGYSLRNTRLIFQIAPNGWHRIQLTGANSAFSGRDHALRKSAIRKEFSPETVEIRKRLNGTAYDTLLSESVVVTELYGAAANNLIVECMARGTPIVVNRLPAIEEYLGTNYPLFYTDPTEIDDLLEDNLLLCARDMLLDRAKKLPTFEEFARRVRDFVGSFTE